MRLTILKEFIKSPRQIGTIFPSSRKLAKEMITDVAIEEAKTIVEIGPGSGVFTKLILEKIAFNGAQLLVVELNKEFYNRLRLKFPNLKIYNESAEELDKILPKEGISEVDLVISGLPWATFPADLQDRILHQIHKVLRRGGYFSTYAYIQGQILPGGIRFRKRLENLFSEVRRSRIVFANLPPAFVYRCRK